MLSALVKESQAKQAKLKTLNDGNRKQALAATESVTNLMTDNVQESVNEVYAAQNKLEKEIKGLQTNTAHFAKQTYQWLEMIKTFNGSLKVCACVRTYVCARTHTRLLRARARACGPPARAALRHRPRPGCSGNFPLSGAGMRRLSELGQDGGMGHAEHCERARLCAAR
jgi:hypothetical protein